MGEIRIVKEKKTTDYTFVVKSLDLGKLTKKKEMPDANKDDGTEPDFRLRDGSTKSKARFESKITGGHSMQGHSPVYE